MGFLSLLMLRDQISQNQGIIEKAKKYVKPGQKAPDGVKLNRGARGGTYYNTEELHAARGTTPKKRLPAFRKQDSGMLVHNTKTGTHGPGSYHIRSDEKGHHLSFTSKTGESQSLGSHADLKELKKMVGGFKAGEKVLTANTTNSSNMKQPAISKKELKAPAHFSDKENERYGDYIPEDKYEYLGLFDDDQSIVPLKENAEKEGYHVFSSYDNWDRNLPEYHKYHAFKAREKDPGLPKERSPYGTNHLHELRYGSGMQSHGALFNTGSTGKAEDGGFWDRYYPKDLGNIKDMDDSHDNPKIVSQVRDKLKTVDSNVVQEFIGHLDAADKVLDRIVSEERAEHEKGYYAKSPFRSSYAEDQNQIQGVRKLLKNALSGKQPYEDKSRVDKEPALKPVSTAKKPEIKPYNATSAAPRFRHLEDGSLSHNTKDGLHGAGNYNIKQNEDQYQISFTPKEGGESRKIIHGKSLSHMKDMVKQYKLSPKQGPYVSWETEYENNRGEDDFSLNQIRALSDKLRNKIKNPDESDEAFEKHDAYHMAAVWLSDTNKNAGNRSGLAEDFDAEAEDYAGRGGWDNHVNAYREVAQLIRDTKPDPVSLKSDPSSNPMIDLVDGKPAKKPKQKSSDSISKKKEIKPKTNQNAIERANNAGFEELERKQNDKSQSTLKSDPYQHAEKMFPRLKGVKNTPGVIRALKEHHPDDVVGAVYTLARGGYDKEEISDNIGLVLKTNGINPESQWEVLNGRTIGDKPGWEKEYQTWKKNRSNNK